MAATYKLIAPPDNWQGATEIPAAALPALELVARRFGGTYRVDESGAKVYFHPSKPAAAPRPPVQTGTKDLILPVTHYAQTDSETAEWYRMCQSSSCAMLLKWLRPGALSNRVNADDDYLKRVKQFGDTTDSGAQLEALRALLDGVATVEYRQDLNFKWLDAQLAKSIPVPIGILHKGPISAPTGGGHWIVVVGRKADGSGYYVNDPNGELDLVAGRYIATDGKCLLYSAANLGRRWMCDSNGASTPGRNGWGYIATRKP